MVGLLSEGRRSDGKREGTWRGGGCDAREDIRKIFLSFDVVTMSTKLREVEQFPQSSKSTGPQLKKI